MRFPEHKMTADRTFFVQLDGGTSNNIEVNMNIEDGCYKTGLATTCKLCPTAWAMVMRLKSLRTQLHNVLVCALALLPQRRALANHVAE